LELLLATDYRIASGDLRLHLPVNSGLVWPGMVVHRLVNQTGMGRARQLLWGGHEITAQRALEAGLVDEISATPSDALGAAVSRLGQIPGTELAIRRQLMLEAPETSFEEALGSHLAACDRELRRRQGPGEPDQERPTRAGTR
jgi:isomerase DpgB